MRHPGHGDGGQRGAATASELAGLVAVVVAVLAVLVVAAPRWGADLVDFVERAICQVVAPVTGQWCDAVLGGGDEPGEADPAGELVGAASPTEWRQHTDGEGGIARSTWAPDDGLRCNLDHIEGVYEYYADLAGDRPDLHWAELAATVGPMFYAGWQDMVALRELVQAGEAGKDAAGEVLRQRADLPGPVDRMVERALDSLSAEELTNELAWFERQFLDMQKAIYDDLAWQHEAYVAGGIEEMERLFEVHDDDVAIDAWRAIDAGDVDYGNHLLVRREQRDIIQRHYDEMRARTAGRGGMVPVGEAFTQLFGVLADNPVPGGETFTSWSGWRQWRNVADEDTRMGWITEEVYQPFTDLAHHERQALFDSELRARVEDFRKLDRLPAEFTEAADCH